MRTSSASLLVILLLAAGTLQPTWAEADEARSKDASTTKTEGAASTDAGKTTAGEAEIPPEKLKVIKELIGLTNVEARSDIIKDRIFASARRSFLVSATREVGKSPGFKDVSDEDRKEAIVESAQRMYDSYSKQFAEKIDLKSLVTSVATRVYAKFFTTSELQDMVDFYKTPTGQKARDVMPQVAAESTVRTTELMKGSLTEIVKKVITDEQKHIAEHHSADKAAVESSEETN